MTAALFRPVPNTDRLKALPSVLYASDLGRGNTIKLSTFILDEMHQILVLWDAYARTMTPAADDMSWRELRDHGEAMLRGVAQDIDSPQSSSEQVAKSLGQEDDDALTSAASEHGHLRHASNFTLVQLSSEFRALRACVLRLWMQKIDKVTPAVLDDVIRFNEAIDQALAESIVTYSERASHSRDLFDAILGHDLRGPLSAMILAGDMLGFGEVPAAKVKELAGRVKSSARYMSGMVDDMLEFSRVKLGNAPIPLHRKTADVASLCASAVSDASAMHPRCTFEVVTEGQPSACIDADRARQLLVNLLGNAGQHGVAHVPIQLHATAGDTEIVLRVSNTGKTIPKESLQHIFDPMVRLNPDLASSTQTTSLGLGLYIAREIALAHGGSLSVESKDDRTTFTARLTWESADSQEAG